MLIRANEIKQYMNIHGVDRVPLEAIETDIPKLGYQRAKKLSTKRLVVFNCHDGGGIIYLEYNDADHRRGEISVSDGFQFNIVVGTEGQNMLDDLARYENGLEARFRQAVEQHNPEIQAKLTEAAELIRQAENISNEHGIPFRPDATITGFSMSYIPKNFNAIFGNLDRDLIYDLTRASGQEYDGWQTSQTC